MDISVHVSGRKLLTVTKKSVLYLLINSVICATERKQSRRAKYVDLLETK